MFDLVINIDISEMYFRCQRYVCYILNEIADKDIIDRI